MRKVERCLQSSGREQRICADDTKSGSAHTKIISRKGVSLTRYCAQHDKDGARQDKSRRRKRRTSAWQQHQDQICKPPNDPELHADRLFPPSIMDRPVTAAKFAQVMEGLAKAGLASRKQSTSTLKLKRDLSIADDIWRQRPFSKDLASQQRDEQLSEKQQGRNDQPQRRSLQNPEHHRRALSMAAAKQPTGYGYALKSQCHNFRMLCHDVESNDDQAQFAQAFKDLFQQETRSEARIETLETKRAKLLALIREVESAEEVPSHVKTYLQTL